MKRVWMIAKNRPKKEKWINVPAAKGIESPSNLMRRATSIMSEERRKIQIEKLLEEHSKGLTTDEIAKILNFNTIFLLRVLPDMSKEGRIKRKIKIA